MAIRIFACVFVAGLVLQTTSASDLMHQIPDIVPVLQNVMQVVIKEGEGVVKNYMDTLNTQTDEYIANAVKRLNDHIKKTEKLIKDAKQKVTNKKALKCFNDADVKQLSQETSAELSGCSQGSQELARKFSQNILAKIRNVINPIKHLKNAASDCSVDIGCHMVNGNEILEFSNVLPQQVQQHLDQLFESVLARLKTISDCGNFELKRLYLQSTHLLQTLAMCVNSRMGRTLITFHTH